MYVIIRGKVGVNKCSTSFISVLKVLIILLQIPKQSIQNDVQPAIFNVNLKWLVMAG